MSYEKCSGSECNRALRLDTKCTACQNAARRATKSGNKYRAHGPMQTDKTRTWRNRGGAA